MALSFLLLSLIFNGLFSFSVWAVLLALLLDAFGFVVIAIYLISLRSFIPEALLTQTDSLVVQIYGKSIWPQNKISLFSITLMNTEFNL